MKDISKNYGRAQIVLIIKERMTNRPVYDMCKCNSLETVLILFDKFVKHDLNECNQYHSFRSLSKKFIIDSQPSEVFQP